MHTERHRQYIIQFLYYALIGSGLFVFFRYIVYMIMPFLIGFFIAYSLRPLVLRLAKHGHERAYAYLVITIFYTCFIILFLWVMIQSFVCIREWILYLPVFYKNYISPYVALSPTSLHYAFKNMDNRTAYMLSSISQALQSTLGTWIQGIANYLFTSLTNIMSSLPSIFMSFFFAIVSSFFIHADYHNIMHGIAQALPKHIYATLLSIHQFFKTTMKALCKAYAKLMLLTFIELCIGFYILGASHIIWIAFAIALFDIIPILGTGGILLPWCLLSWAQQQHKFAVGLLIIYLVITLIRSIIEPRIVGHQINLHPLLMLICMYLGAKLFGILGIFILPLLLLTIKHLHEQAPY